MSDASYSANKVNRNNDNESKRINTTGAKIKSAASSSAAPPQRKCIIRRCHKYRCRNRMCTRHNKEYSGNPPRHVIDRDDDDEDDDDDSDDSPPRTTESPSLAPHRYKLCILKTCRSKIHEDVIDSMHGMCWKHYSQYRGRDIPIKLMVRRNWRLSQRNLKRQRDPDHPRENASGGIPRRDQDENDAPIQNIAMLHSKLIHHTTCNPDDCSSITSGNSRMGNSTVPSDRDDDEDASSLPPKKHAKATTTGRYCCIRGCRQKLYSSAQQGICRKHFLLFGSHPPPELKCRFTPQQSHGHDQKDEYNRTWCPDANFDAREKEMEGLYKAYYFAQKNREWRLCHGGGARGERNAPMKRKQGDDRCGTEQEKNSDLAFPLEMQRKFANVRRECIRQSKREWCGYVMKKRLGREREKSIKSTECLGKSPSCHTLLLEGKKGIPAALARQIVQNIKDKDLPAFESIHDAVLFEAQRVLGLHDDANGTSFANQLQPGRCYLCNYASYWDRRGQGGDGQGNVYKHMSIDMIDDFIEWATSHTRKHQHAHPISDAAQPAGAVEQDEAMYSGLLHVPKAPPPPSQNAFLRHRLDKELFKQFQVLYPHADPDNNSKKAQDLLGCVDSSALVAIGIAIEEVMTASLIPLAKAHVERCRGLERVHNLQSSDGLEQEEKESTTQSCGDPFVAWTLPIAEAISELTRDESTNHASCSLLSLKPPKAVLNSDVSMQFSNSLGESNNCEESLSQ